MFDGADIAAFLAPWIVLGLLGVVAFRLLIPPLAKTRAWWVPGAVMLLGGVIRLATLPVYGGGFEGLVGIVLLVLGSAALVAVAVARPSAATAPAATAIEPAAPMPSAIVVRRRDRVVAHRSRQEG